MTRSHYVKYFIAAVWIVNGLLCKVLSLIVARILDQEHAGFLTMSIGVAEILMGIWIISGFLPKLNAISQIIIIAVMNILEFLIVPDLLLWGRGNLIFACLFIALIYMNEFHLKKKSV